MTLRIWTVRLALFIIGLYFIVGIYALMIYYPRGWVWEPRQIEYEFMLLGIYATLGVFLLWAIKNPLQHKSIIWFTVWSCIIRATIMVVEALVHKQYWHFTGDIPTFYFIAALLGYLMPTKKRMTKEAAGEVNES